LVVESILNRLGSVGAVAQLGERRFCKPEVVGSIPISSTNLIRELSEEWFCWNHRSLIFLVSRSVERISKLRLFFDN
jgi:hypothetical protein